MGIPEFLKYVKDTYKSSIRSTWLKSYDNMYVDLNHILHHVCYTSKNTNEILSKLRDYLTMLVVSCKPKKRLYLGADGPAPMAKMPLQRKKRLDTVKKKEVFDISKNLNLHFTPGTLFMNSLEHELRGFVEYIKKKFNIEVIVSITEPDEGEIKIRNKIKKIDEKNPNETHIIFSGDSDMILILFTCDELNNIYQVFDKNTTLHYGTMLKLHRQKFGQTNTDKYDFVFLNLLMGNDYIPKTSYINLENLWGAYKKLSPYKKNGLVLIDEKDKTNVKIDNMFFFELIHYATENTSKNFAKKFKITDMADDSYDNYIDGLYWCFGMYITGTCSNYTYVYDHSKSPHYYGVAISILMRSTYKITKTDCIDVDLYGILLIPEKANKLLSREQSLIIEKLVKKHPIIYAEERCNECKKIFSAITLTNQNIGKEDGDSDEYMKLSKKLTVLKRKYKTHKNVHPRLSSVSLNAIKTDFIKCREEIRETVDLNEDYHYDNNTHHNDVVIPYNPSNNSNLIKKKLF